MTSMDLVNVDLSKIYELEFKTIIRIIRTLAGLEKKHGKHQSIPSCRDKRTKI